MKQREGWKWKRRQRQEQRRTLVQRRWSMKQREGWKARAPVRARSAAHSPSGFVFVALQLLETQNSVLSVEAKAKTRAKAKASANKTR
eukprot:2002200-Rhodomonas_salina.1